MEQTNRTQEQTRKTLAVTLNAWREMVERAAEESADLDRLYLAYRILIGGKQRAVEGRQ